MKTTTSCRIFHLKSAGLAFLISLLPLLALAQTDASTFATNSLGDISTIRKAAERNDAEAQFKLGQCYRKGENVEQNSIEAVKWYRKAAEQNYAPAQNNLGACYAQGVGVNQDSQEAVEWYRKAANQSYTNAQHNLAACYTKGMGVNQSFPEAVKWYRKAAEQKYAKSQYSLGLCFELGAGVAEDWIEAYHWYGLAEDQGLIEAIKRKADLLKRMSLTTLRAVMQRTRLTSAAIWPHRKVDTRLYDLSPRIRWDFLVSSNGIENVYVDKPSPDWEFLLGQVFQVVNDGILLKKFKESDIQMEGEYELVFIMNKPDYASLEDDRPQAFYALSSHTSYSYFNSAGARKSVASYDFGQIPSGLEVKQLKELDEATQKAELAAAAVRRGVTERAGKARIDAAKASAAERANAAAERARVAAERALTSDQADAAKGDAYGLLRMGERYRDGDGVEKDSAKAEEYLTKAVKAGSPAAVRALADLQQAATNPSAKQ